MKQKKMEPQKWTNYMFNMISMERSSRQNICKETMDWNYTLDPMDLTGV